MSNLVADHYSGSGDLAKAIADSLCRAGQDLSKVATADLATVDEFHIGGRPATLELARHLKLGQSTHLLDIGSGLGGPARTIAETHACRVTGIDLTPAFCNAATVLSTWVGLSDRVYFREGDATALPFDDGTFDAAMTIHVAMNIASKDRMYAEARRVLKRGARFGVYDVLQGEGGSVLFPVPWAREASTSHLATPSEMSRLLSEAGFLILDVRDTTNESQYWFENLSSRMATAPPPVSFLLFLGDAFADMAANQVRNLRERRIRTATYICQAD